MKKLGSDHCQLCGINLQVFEDRVQHLCKECQKKHLEEFFSKLSEIQKERSAAATAALPAMARLAAVLSGRSGQPYKLRSLLFSAWNGKPASLVEIVGFDWEIRKDLCTVLLAFGDENFFYRELETAIRNAGQWEFFQAESEEVESLEQYVLVRKEQLARKGET